MTIPQSKTISYETVTSDIVNRYQLPKEKALKIVDDIIFALNGHGNYLQIPPIPIRDSLFEFPILRLTSSRITERIIVDNVFKTLCQNLGMRYNPVICQGARNGKYRVDREVKCGEYGRADMVTSSAIIEFKRKLTSSSIKEAIGQLHGYSLSIRNKKTIVSGFIDDANVNSILAISRINHVFVMRIVEKAQPPKRLFSNNKWKNLLF